MSKNKKIILTGIGIGSALALVLVLTFLAGVFVGRHREIRFFPFREGNYSENVPGMMGHGTVGTIDSLGNNSIVVKDRTGALKTILFEDQTKIRENGNSIKFSDLKKDEPVIVLGDPDQQEGAIKARVVRVISQTDQITGPRGPVMMVR